MLRWQLIVFIGDGEQLHGLPDVRLQAQHQQDIGVTKMKAKTITSLLLGMLIMAGAASASATAVTCTPTYVGWQSNALTNFSFACSEQPGKQFYVVMNATCAGPARSADTMKAMMSLVQTALLAGKKIGFDNTSCDGRENVGDYVTLYK